MMRKILHAKIHRATVTQADLNYVGSISIDQKIIKAAGLVLYEAVHIVDITNGARLHTYVIPAEEGSGIIQINGAAAHLVKKNDLISTRAFET
jgi:aspartate 1-decarboxylase